MPKVAKQFHAWLGPLGVLPASYAAVEQDYLDFLHKLDAHFEQHPYLLRGAPTQSDFAFFGPLYAHLLRDPASGITMQARAPRVVAWMDRLRAGASDAIPLSDLATPPRHCATQRVTLGRGTAQQVEVTRPVLPYNQWMLQRVQDAWAATAQHERTTVRAMLTDCGAEDLLNIPLTCG